MTGECEVGQGNRDAGLPVVSLVPVDGWWFATWYGSSPDPSISVDVCTPATLVDSEWTYVDLEDVGWQWLRRGMAIPLPPLTELT
ncbi:MAG: hypothetical protein ACRD0A_07200 [Acidimicrobiales bacterium]